MDDRDERARAAVPVAPSLPVGPLVREATLGDVPALARVQVASWRRAYHGLIPEHMIAAQTEERRRWSWQRVVAAGQHGLRVAVRSEQVIGYGQLVASRDAGAVDTGEIAALYVDPEHWRSGAGRALLTAGIGLARQRGYRALTLWVLESNAAARRFYERMGLAPDGETKTELREGGSLFEVRYRMQLGSGEPLG
jgi:ribosomal protein S18 acetylase RimI-like enzyme